MNLTPEIVSLEATVKFLETIANTADVSFMINYPALTSSINATNKVIESLKKKNEEIKTKS